MSRGKILVVEDEPDIAELLEYHLVREQYEVGIAHSGDAALERIRADPPDLVLLDLMLPGLDGTELCRVLKRAPQTESVPIVMVTAKTEEIDRIVGLELGADDYITKPFSPREVVLRVKAVLRRSSAPPPEQERRISSGALVLDRAAHRLFVSGEEVLLTATEFRLLARLMESPGRVLTREALLTEVWGYAAEVGSRTVDTHIRRLRMKLGSEADRIETVIGVGYRLRS